MMMGRVHGRPGPQELRTDRPLTPQCGVVPSAFGSVEWPRVGGEADEDEAVWSIGGCWGARGDGGTLSPLGAVAGGVEPAGRGVRGVGRGGGAGFGGHPVAEAGLQPREVEPAELLVAHPLR